MDGRTLVNKLLFVCGVFGYFDCVIQHLCRFVVKEGTGLNCSAVLEER